jgi:hypothetical protein
MDNGALYVPGGGISAATAAIDALEDRMDAAEDGIDAVESGLAAEIARATSEERRIETKLDNEVTRSTEKDVELNTALNNEISERRTTDANIQNALSAEQLARIDKDAELELAIRTETARSISEEARIEAKLDNEITRSTTEDNRLNGLISAETANRIAADEALDDKIDSITLTFEDTSSIDFNSPYNEDNVVKANVKLQEGENIIKLGEGIYASVSLSYDSARNTIKLVTSNGEQEAIQLNNVGSLIDGIEYDPVNRALVITYHDAAGNVLHTSFPVNELFNDWIIQNPSEKSALELTKIINSGDVADVLKGRVLITDDHDGDGKPDQGSDNIIEIRNNGLYVDGSSISSVTETVECVKKELKTVENNILGMPLMNECGEGDNYRPNPATNYIFSGTSFNNADVILDQELKAANDKIEGILNMWSSGETCTAISDWLEEEKGRVLQVDVKLSHGNLANMSDDDLTTVNLSGSYIDPTRTEFTDTNALRIVCLEEGAGGVTPTVDTKQNGLYLSNVWDCGMYYGPNDAEARAAAEAAGYNTNYVTDEESSATNFNYMNNVRQSDIPHF